MSSDDIVERSGARTSGVWVRQSSGLVREFGVRDLLVYNLIAAAPGLAVAVLPLTIALVVPQDNLALVIVVGGILTIGNGLMYAYMSATMPRAGGEYLYLSRTVSPLLGFAANWGLTWSTFLAVALYASFTFSFGVAVGFVTLGDVLHSNSLISLGNSAGGKWPTFIGGTVIILIVFGIISLGPHLLRKIVNILFIPVAIGGLTMLVVLLTTSHSDFISKYNAFATAHHGLAYNAVVAQASKAGFSIGHMTFGAIILALPIAYYSFVGFTYSAYVGGEVRQPSRSQPNSMMLTLGICVVYYVITFSLLYHVIGSRFFNDLIYLFSNTKVNTGLPITPTSNLLAGIMTSNPALNVLLLIGFIGWPFLLVFPVAITPTRNLFGWAFDRLLPESVTKVDSRFHAPWVATLVVAIIGELLLIFYVFSSFLAVVTNYILLYSVCFWLASIAALVLPYRRPDLIAKAPKAVQRKIAGIPVLTVLGALNLILFTIAIISAFKFPAFSGPTGHSALFFLIAVYVVGVLYYLGAKLVQRRRGIDLSLMQREIPPE
jgi:basic amino acid/polyamine antiporter, APA family